jgi:hypothetical protein
MTPDFTYRVDGQFVLLMPESNEARQVWNEMADAGGMAVHLVIWPTVRQRLKAGGWTVGKAPPVRKTDEQLLADLGLS